jgi:hypothetical protein
MLINFRQLLFLWTIPTIVRSTVSLSKTGRPKKIACNGTMVPVTCRIEFDGMIRVYLDLPLGPADWGCNCPDPCDPFITHNFGDGADYPCQPLPSSAYCGLIDVTVAK